MLEKMGWEGGGLGRSQEGIEEPIQVDARAKHSGLGADVPIQVRFRLQLYQLNMAVFSCTL